MTTTTKWMLLMVAVVAAVVQQLEEGKESSSNFALTEEALTHTKHRNTLNSRYVKRMLG